MIEQGDIKINQLQEEMLRLREIVHTLEEQVNDAAAYSGKESLITSGNIPNGTRDGECKIVVVNLLKEKVKLNIDPRDISIAPRIDSKVT